MSIYDKLGAKTAGVKARTIEKVADKAPKTGPGLFLNATQRIDAAETKAEELEAKLRDMEAQAPGHELTLDLLDEVSGRRRKLSAEEFSELVDNLRNNELVTPVVVRKIDAGRFEIVSGHNRVAAFRALGRTTIPAVISDSDDAQAELNAFYANLLQPALPDYEKYLGFLMIKGRQPTLSHEDIADLAGVSRSQVTKLMSFDGLPKEAHALLQQHVNAIGAHAAKELAMLARQGKSDAVVMAITKVAAGELDQGQAIKFASSTLVKIEKATPEVVKFKSGRATFCEYRRVDKVIRLSFKNADEAAEMEAAIQQVIAERAKQAHDK
jgi:ParB family chromosome partitioning protein